MKLYQSLGELTDLVRRINHHWKFKHPFGAEMDVHLDTKWMIKFPMVVCPLYHVVRVGGGMVVNTMIY